jgi:hypothetical protein
MLSLVSGVQKAPTSNKQIKEVSKQGQQWYEARSCRPQTTQPVATPTDFQWCREGTIARVASAEPFKGAAAVAGANHQSWERAHEAGDVRVEWQLRLLNSASR